MKDWLDSIPLDEILPTYHSLKDELTEHYRDELQLLSEHHIMSQGQRAKFYEEEKEIVMKLILLAGGYEVTKVMHECWLLARKDYPTSPAFGPSYLLPCHRDGRV